MISEPERTVASTTTTPKAKPASGSAAGHTYDYFRDKWDKFDVDAALAEADAPPAEGGGAGSESAADEAAAGTSEEPDMHPAVAAARRGKGEGKGADPAAVAREAEEHKTRGNDLFNRGDFGAALASYTSSLGLRPTCVAYANRAMARLKLGDAAAAESDCTVCFVSYILASRSPCPMAAWLTHPPSFCVCATIASLALR